MFSPASSPYQKLAEECVKYGVGVELFLFPTNYCDMATLGDFVSTTGGEVHYYRGYQVSQYIATVLYSVQCPMCNVMKVWKAYIQRLIPVSGEAIPAPAEECLY